MLFGNFVFALTLLVFDSSLGHEEKKIEKDETRDPKLFSLFNIVTFPNDMCTGKTSGDMGTCFTSTECSSKSGKIDGNCAAGFGVCCLFSVTSCGSSITYNRTYITNPGYPSAYTSTSTVSCSYTVTPLSSDICQLRLDFDTFSLAYTSSDGDCDVDTFKISGPDVTYPTLCATLTGDHIYVETDRDTDAQTLAFTIAATTGSATYKIKVSQIECFSIHRAPPGCYQYMTGRTGRVKSLNRSNSRMLKNLQYTICIRREPGTCGIIWGVTSTTEYTAYSLAAPAEAEVGTDAAAAVTYIAIPGAMAADYSGQIFADYDAATSDGTITATGHNYHVHVFSNSVDKPAATTLGFDLTYHQAPCNSVLNNIGNAAG